MITYSPEIALLPSATMASDKRCSESVFKLPWILARSVVDTTVGIGDIAIAGYSYPSATTSGNWKWRETKADNTGGFSDNGTLERRGTFGKIGWNAGTGGAAPGGNEDSTNIWYPRAFRNVRFEPSGYPDASTNYKYKIYGPCWGLLAQYVAANWWDLYGPGTAAFGPTDTELESITPDSWSEFRLAMNIYLDFTPTNASATFTYLGTDYHACSIAQCWIGKHRSDFSW